jgi:hypothetical protein
MVSHGGPAPVKPSTRVVLTVCLIALLSPLLFSQARGGQRGGPPPTAKAAAPIDLTGYWAAVLTEDWYLRMLTPPKGDFGTGVGLETPGGEQLWNIPYKPKGFDAAKTWDPAKDEADGNQCKAYGAGGIMRQPTRLHITWQDDNTLKIETDLGTQTRLFHFGPPPKPGVMGFQNGTYIPPEVTKFDAPANEPPALQGYSIAEWTAMGTGRGNFERGGSLKVVTTHLKPGYYWKNGVPYTGDAVITEYFRVMDLPDNSNWIRFTQIVEDPELLVAPFVVNYQFKKLPDGSKWSPAPCTVK